VRLKALRRVRALGPLDALAIDKLESLYAKVTATSRAITLFSLRTQDSVP